MWATTLLIAASMPITEQLSESVDRIEVNHVFDGDGRLVIDQVIFWRWNWLAGDFEVIDWRLLRCCRCPVTDEQHLRWRKTPGSTPPPIGKFVPVHAYPQYDYRTRMHVSHWRDERTDSWRMISAPIFIETWTNHDREIQQRSILPQAKRRFLRRP